MFKWLRAGGGTVLHEVWTFAREAGAAKFGEAVFKHTEEVLHEDPRKEMMEGIRRLEKVPGKAGKAARLFARLDWAARTNQPDFENNVMLALGHLLPRDREKNVRWQEAVEILEWVADKDDASFAVIVEAMKHDPIAHMVHYLIDKYGLPGLKQASGYVFEAAKIGSEAAKNGLKAAVDKFPELDARAGEAILRWRASQRWIKRSRRRQDELENQLRRLEERWIRERSAKLYDQFNREWAGRHRDWRNQ